MTTPAIKTEITMTMLEDIERALANVARDYLPTSKAQTFLHPPGDDREGPSVTLKIMGPSNDVLIAALTELAEGLKVGLAETFPSLPLRMVVIGGSEAAGIIITPEPEADPVYGHVIKARLAWLRPSDWLRRLRPNLPERIDL